MKSHSSEIIPSDWYEEALRRNSLGETRLEDNQLSAAWAGRTGKGGRVPELKEIRDIVRNLVRVHGVPKACRVELAGSGLEGAAAAGFDDAPASFVRPFILLDTRPYESCSRQEVLDVYAGLGLHEASHVLHTRDAYRRLAAGMSPERRRYENLWEDERIEQLVREESPGFGRYLQVTKRVLLEQQELGQSLAGWDNLPDMHRINALIFAFIRCPYLITEPMQNWTAINDENVFATLRTLFPAAPANEADVERGGKLLEQLCRRLRELYADDSSASPSPSGTSSGSGSSEVDKRRQQQRRADAEDRAVEAATTHGQTDVKEAIRLLLDEAAKMEAAGASDESQALMEEALRWEESGNVWKGRQGRRFGGPESERLERHTDTITCPLSPEEEKELDELGRVQATEEDCWEWGGERRTVVNHPVADDEARQCYVLVKQDVRGHVAALRAALAIRHADRVYHETERSRGRLDPRRLALAPITDRVFRRTTTRSSQGLALALLLDASGSMTEGDPSKCSVALRVGALAAEALPAVPGIELEIYAHTSCGEEHRDCLLQYLYGRQNRDRTTVGCYSGWGMNYDHQAILTTARLFVQNTRNSHRVLIAVSDGHPRGLRYGGKRAIEATREAVEAVRRRGIQVLSVAVTDYASEAIFGAAHVLHFTDMGRFVADMRNLFTRLVWARANTAAST